MRAKILMIDDDRDLLEVTGAVLEAQGYEFYQAQSGTAGLARLVDVHPDAVILDVMMEDETAGFPVLNAIRMAEEDSELGAFRDVPLLMLTGAQQKLQADLERKAGTPLLSTDVFFSEPVEPTELFGALQRMLEHEQVAGEPTT
ncbi:MAG: response regulator [Deltaproteobacteria bacterium]|nr:response regulator [Deltaproteobacteria bacterium]